MDIQIRVGGNAEGGDAQIRRTTFNQVRQIKQLQLINDQNVVIAGDTFGDQFRILLSEDVNVPENVLFVSPAVKQRFYLNTDTLRVLAA